jgi:integrase
MQNQKTLPKTPERITVRRKRFQIGCLRKMKRGRQWIWIGKYYENGEGRTRVLGNCVQMTEGGARAKLQEILYPINQGAGFRPGLPTNFRDYVLKVFLPQRRKKWKASTDITTTERFKIYLLTGLGDYQMTELTRDRLQLFLDEKVSSGLSTSVVDHLRWDLNAIFKMASDDAILHGNPAGSLVTPKGAAPPTKRSLTIEEIQTALSVLELRERIIFMFGVLVGMRPGEILALRWASIGEGRLQITERVYRGVRGNPKTRRSLREAAIPPGLAMDIERWRALSNDTSPDALVFPSERGTFLSRDNFLRRNFHNKLNKVGLGWIAFQVLRRTQASLSHKEGIDPKISADQRGHGIGVALDTYTITDLASRRNAVTVLETALAKNARPQQTGFSR